MNPTANNQNRQQKFNRDSQFIRKAGVISKNKEEARQDKNRACKFDREPESNQFSIVKKKYDEGHSFNVVVMPYTFGLIACDIDYPERLTAEQKDFLKTGYFIPSVSGASNKGHFYFRSPDDTKIKDIKRDMKTQDGEKIGEVLGRYIRHGDPDVAIETKPFLFMEPERRAKLPVFDVHKAVELGLITLADKGGRPAKIYASDTDFIDTLGQLLHTTCNGLGYEDGEKEIYLSLAHEYKDDPDTYQAICHAWHGGRVNNEAKIQKEIDHHFKYDRSKHPQPVTLSWLLKFLQSRCKAQVVKFPKELKGFVPGLRLGDDYSFRAFMAKDNFNIEFSIRKGRGGEVFWRHIDRDGFIFPYLKEGDQNLDLWRVVDDNFITRISKRFIYAEKRKLPRLEIEKEIDTMKDDSRLERSFFIDKLEDYTRNVYLPERQKKGVFMLPDFYAPDELMLAIFDIPTRYQAYAREWLRLLLTGLIFRQLVPGAKFDYMPLLQGPEGVLKSVFYEYLVLSEDAREYSWIEKHLDLDAGNKDRMIALQKGAIILIYDEMKGNAEWRKLKALLTDTDLSARLNHANHQSRIWLSHINVGTANNDWLFPTGEGKRRFLPLPVTGYNMKLEEFYPYMKAHIWDIWAWIYCQITNNMNDADTPKTYQDTLRSDLLVLSQRSKNLITPYIEQKTYKYQRDDYFSDEEAA